MSLFVNGIAIFNCSKVVCLDSVIVWNYESEMLDWVKKIWEKV